MEPQADFKDLLALFNKQRVKYLIVGAYALAFHGAPRFTGDIDILVKPCPENAKRILLSLEAFGFGALGLTMDDFEKPGQVIQLGVPPVRVDLITSLTGVSWKEAFSGKVKDSYGGIPVHYIGRKQLVLNKRETKRKKDLADLEALGEK